MDDKTVLMLINQLSVQSYQNSADHGFWEKERNKGEMIALMHSELSEALEAVRKPGPSDHIPDFSLLEEEMADVLVRVFDFCGGFKLRLGEALLAKMEYNKSRPFKHGKLC